MEASYDMSDIEAFVKEAMADLRKEWGRLKLRTWRINIAKGNLQLQVVAVTPEGVEHFHNTAI